MKYLSAGGMSRKLPSSPLHLEYLFLNVYMTEQNETSSLLCLIRSSPLLVKIILWVYGDEKLSAKKDATNLDPDDYSDLKLDHLKTLKIEATLKPIRYALTSSILSKKWRYSWRTMPKLLFIDDMVRLCGVLKEYNLVIAIFDVLLFHNGPTLLEFDFSVGEMVSECNLIISVLMIDVTKSSFYALVSLVSISAIVDALSVVFIALGAAPGSLFRHGMSLERVFIHQCAAHRPMLGAWVIHLCAAHRPRYQEIVKVYSSSGVHVAVVEHPATDSSSYQVYTSHQLRSNLIRPCGKMKTQCLSLDRISTLPDNIIETILTLMPIRDALRTSVLSKKWRCSWQSMPKLVFKDDMLKVTPSQLKTVSQLEFGTTSISVGITFCKVNH
ncbi:hypothetical protein QVD17_20921 [Tagetes erecta]|uniref:F-box domain-containing protein n=1 Tax=Tagetes erecta TaxID=13708 RepID=A0AAD8NYE4_TARER|nr:hypothetical protein QVD17_20921 [Tagetes erecta]